MSTPMRCPDSYKVADEDRAAIHKDGERYRWLRAQLVAFGCYDTPEQVDEACDTGDAALAGERS